MITVQNAIRAALRKSGVIGQGQIPNSDELNDSLEELIRMIDAWDADSLNAYAIRFDLIQLTAQQQAYTIGIDPSGATTANFQLPRPTKIVNANLQFSTSPVIRRPLVLLSQEEWARKRLQDIFTFPAQLYNDMAEPLSTLRFYPIPDSAYNIELYTWQQLSTYSNLTDNVLVPPGYEDALVLNLAVRLAFEFGKRPDPELANMASRAKALIESKNSSPAPRLRTEPGINGRHGMRGQYNRFTGLMDA